MNMNYLSSGLVVSAIRVLSYRWSKVYGDLVENPQNPNWYIDDRADPKSFWALVSLTNPDILVKRKIKITKTMLKRAIDELAKPENMTLLTHWPPN